MQEPNAGKAGCLKQNQNGNLKTFGFTQDILSLMI